MVVLREGLFFVPGCRRDCYFLDGCLREEKGRRRGLIGKKMGQGEEWIYQFLAMMGLAWRFNFLDLGLCFTLLREDLFFFFWSSRPIVQFLYEKQEYSIGCGESSELSFDVWSRVGMMSKTSC